MIEPAVEKMNCLSGVREQYENFPYPYRQPEDEKKRLVNTIPDYLPKISHYCYKGKKVFSNSFRALIAGGGTGDTTIFLAEQLRDTDAEIVYIDLSTASMDIARQRAAIRGLNNIKWIHGSLLDIGRMGLDKFDYISSTGVLHHLEDPTEGLRSLKSVLKDDGAMGLMVYGKYGRTGIYQIQELMRLVNTNEPDMRVQLDNTRAIFKTLPETNWFMRRFRYVQDASGSGQDKYEKLIFEKTLEKDIELFDVYLHTQDRPYTVGQVYEWLSSCELELVDFINNKSCYRAQTYINDPDLMQKIEKLSIDKQQAIAEVMCGTLGQHFFYASQIKNTIADLEDLDNIPAFYKCISHEQIYNAVKDQPPGKAMKIEVNNGECAEILINNNTKYIFRYMDGKTSLKKIMEFVKEDNRMEKNKTSNEEIFASIKDIYEVFNMLDIMVLRHKSVPPYKTEL